MGWLTPKYPKSDTPGATSAPTPNESRADRKQREYRDRLDTDLNNRFKAAERASKERSAAFWNDYERRNGKGSVDYS